MKPLRLIPVVLILIVLSGCPFEWDTSSDRLDSMEELVGITSKQIDSMDDDIGKLKLVIEEGQAAIANADIDPATKAKIISIMTEASAGLEIALDKRIELQASIARWQEKITQIRTGEEGIGHELQIYGAGLKESAHYIPQPVGPWVGLGGTLLALVGSVVVSLKQKKADKNILTDTVTSVDGLLKSMDDATAQAAKEMLKDGQSPDTRAAISKVHAA